MSKCGTRLLSIVKKPFSLSSLGLVISQMGRITRLEFTNAKTMIHATLAQQQQTLTSLRSTDLSQDLLGVAQSSHQLQLEKVLRKEEKDAEGRYRERLRTLALQMFAVRVAFVFFRLLSPSPSACSLSLSLYTLCLDTEHVDL